MRVQTVGGLGYVVDGSNINTTFTMMLYYGVLPGLLYLLLQIKACFKMTDNRCISAVILIITLIITTFFMYFARKIENKKAYEIQFEG